MMGKIHDHLCANGNFVNGLINGEGGGGGKSVSVDVYPRNDSNLTVVLCRAENGLPHSAAAATENQVNHSGSFLFYVEIEIQIKPC